ncbi:MAG: hypothetical protein IJ244_02610 [Bacteroidaceae bacterium]|nr:hypothetical protein [Bacteroidaceae bacterium]
MDDILGIAPVIMSEAEAGQPVYDLQGRRATSPNLDTYYIIKGKKTAFRRGE